VVSICHALTIDPAAHTFPYRLSAVAAEKMNQIDQSEVRGPKCWVANHKSQISQALNGRWSDHELSVGKEKPRTYQTARATGRGTSHLVMKQQLAVVLGRQPVVEAAEVTLIRPRRLVRTPVAVHLLPSRR